jgi:hypothetical protein
VSPVEKFVVALAAVFLIGVAAAAVIHAPCR